MTTPRKLPLAPVRPGWKRGFRSRRMLRERGEVCPRRPLENSDQTCPLTRSLYPTALPERGPHKGHAETQDDQNHSLLEALSRRMKTDTDSDATSASYFGRGGVEFWDWGCQSNSAIAEKTCSFSPRCGWGVSQSIQWGELEAEALPTDDSEAKTRLVGGAASGGRDPWPEMMGRRDEAQSLV